MLNITNLKEYGVLFHAKYNELDIEKYEKMLIHFNYCLEKLRYKDVEIDAQYLSNNSIILIIKNKKKRFEIDLMNFIIGDGLFFKYKVMASDDLDELLAILELYPKYNTAGFESIDHDRKTDHIYYCLKTLKYFL